MTGFRPKIPFSDCPWIIKPYSHGWYRNTKCAVTDKECSLEDYYEEKPLHKCHLIIRFAHVAKRQHGKPQSLKDHEFLKKMLFAPYSTIRLLGLLEYRGCVKLKKLKVRIGIALQKKCREEPSCPYKALLPETEVPK